MALYQSSWTILFAPLLSFVAIIFGTRMWDLASRQNGIARGHGDTHVFGYDDE